jgi:hypothetical protein
MKNECTANEVKGERRGYDDDIYTHKQTTAQCLREREECWEDGGWIGKNESSHVDGYTHTVII